MEHFGFISGKRRHVGIGGNNVWKILQRLIFPIGNAIRNED